MGFSPSAVLSIPLLHQLLGTALLESAVKSKNTIIILNFRTDRSGENSADPDQTAPTGAV